MSGSLCNTRVVQGVAQWIMLLTNHLSEVFLRLFAFPIVIRGKYSVTH